MNQKINAFANESLNCCPGFVVDLLYESLFPCAFGYADVTSGLAEWAQGDKNSWKSSFGVAFSKNGSHNDKVYPGYGSIFSIFTSTYEY